MKNKFKFDELVKVNGMGKQFGNVKNELGFVIERDIYYKDYNIQIVFGNEDWFEEESIKKVNMLQNCRERKKK